MEEYKRYSPVYEISMDIGVLARTPRLTLLSLEWAAILCVNLSMSLDVVLKVLRFPV